MLLSSQADFNYDNQTSSSNPSKGAPAGDDNSGRGGRYRNIFSGGRSGGSGSSSRGSSRIDNRGRNHNSRPSATRERNERPNKPPNYRLSRDDLRDFALSTLRVLDDGEYFPPGAVEPYDLKTKIIWTDENTRYYGPDVGGEILESEFVKINEEDHNQGKNDEKDRDVKMDAGEVDGTKQGENESATAENKQTDNNLNHKAQASIPTDSATLDTPIYIGEYSTLVGARRIHLALASNLNPSTDKKIGVLNFASAKKPGGGFINGSQAQEESIARASTLYPSLITTTASQFYAHYYEDPNNPYYTHAMVYSPGVILLRDDSGEWRSPVEVDVLTSAAVNAGEVRHRLEREERLRQEREEMEIWKRKGEERRWEKEKALAAREGVGRGMEVLRGEREMLKREKEKLKKEQMEVAKLKEKAELTKLQKGMVKNEDGNEMKGKEKDSGSEKEETSIEQEKMAAEGEAAAEKLEENQEGKSTDNPESGSSSDGEMKKAEETIKSKGASVQDDQPQPEAPPKVNQEPTSLSHPLLSQNQPTQAPNPDPNLSYALALSNAESQIKHIMYTRISRILHLFQLHQIPHLVLGSFGTGVFQNRIDLVATIFADLLVKPGGRFKNVFKTVVFAILGKETVRVFEHVFPRFEKLGQSKNGDSTGGSCVFLDEDGGEEDVKEGEEERAMRMMRWEARRTALADAAQAEADAASFAVTQADAAAYAVHPGVASAVQTDPAAADDRITEDEKMILTENDNLVAEETTTTATPKATIIDDSKDVEMVEIKSLPASYREAQNSKSNKKEDDDVEMQ